MQESVQKGDAAEAGRTFLKIVKRLPALHERNHEDAALLALLHRKSRHFRRSSKSKTGAYQTLQPS